MYKVLLHIGLPKTATTSLQCNVLYPLHIQGRINFLGRYLESTDNEFYNPVGNIICQLDENKTDEEIVILQKELHKLFESSKLNVISEECISLTHNEKHYIRFRNLSRLLKKCDVTVLLSIRNPVDFMFSYYVEMHKWHYHSVKDSNTFGKFVESCLKEPNKSEFDILFFNRFVRLVQQNFQSVRVVLFEDIKNDPEAYFLSLSEFLPESTEELSKLFFGNIMNTRVYLTNGKVGEAITLDRKVSSFLSSLVSLNIISSIKKNKALKNIYHWILVKMSKVRLGKPVEHVLSDEVVKKMKPLLLVSHDNLMMCSKDKLKKYGYLK